jgi:hypothetical protein
LALRTPQFVPVLILLRAASPIANDMSHVGSANEYLPDQRKGSGRRHRENDAGNVGNKRALILAP